MGVGFGATSTVCHTIMLCFEQASEQQSAQTMALPELQLVILIDLIF